MRYKRYQLNALNMTSLLRNKFPNLFVEIHSTKNKKIDLDSLTYGSKCKIWWRCVKNKKHVWVATPNSRTCKNKTGCPFCRGINVLPEESLGELYPELIEKRWDYERNDTSPTELPPRTNKKAFWLCEMKHSYESSISDVTAKGLAYGCPYCCGQKTTLENSLKTHHSELCEEWNYKRNSKGPEEYTRASGRKVWWRCSTDQNHEWESTVINRTHNKNGCPHCAGRPTKRIGLEESNPELIEEWNHEVNGDLSIYSRGSMRVVNWICKKNPKHVWDASIRNRVRGCKSCPHCSGKKIKEMKRNPVKKREKNEKGVPEERSLVSKFPSLVEKKWDYKKNTVNPKDVFAFSTTVVWWKCENNPDHSFDAKICEITAQKLECPYCSGTRVNHTNSFQAKFPDMMKEWHPNNKVKPDEVTAYSSTKKVKWICSNDSTHVWEARIDHRTVSGNGCPICYESKGEKAVRGFLTAREIFFIPQKTFSGSSEDIMRYGVKEVCKDKALLRYDFYAEIPVVEDNTFIFVDPVLIEFHGLQHQQPVEYFGGEAGFKRTQHRDKIKREFALKNGIPLYEILYDEDLDEALEEIVSRRDQEEV